MKRIWSVLLVIVTVLAFSSCGQTEQDRDRYQYDTYLNAQWGSDPDEVFADLGISKKLVARQSEADNEEKGYPDGTFSYRIAQTTSLYGLPVSVEFLFADHLYDLPQHVGLYAVKITFIEDYPATFAANSIQWEPSDYKLDADLASEEINKRILYNNQYETADQDNLWTMRRWSCQTTPVSLSGERGVALCEALEATGEMGESLIQKPLSSISMYYNHPDEYSYMVYEGFSAALLRNME